MEMFRGRWSEPGEQPGGLTLSQENGRLLFGWDVCAPCVCSSQEQLISGNSPMLGCQFALAIAHPCGDKLDIQGACRMGALERDGLFPMGCLGASVVVPGMLCRWIIRSVRGR